MKTLKLLTSVVAVLALVTAWSSAASAGSPYARSDGDWVSLTGEVANTTLDGFDLDYGDGQIKVELDDWDSYDESQLIADGERVTVYGRVDNALFEERTIEAGVVYVFDRNSYIYASSADEEGDYEFSGVENVYPYLRDGHWIQLTGTVDEVDGREFTLDIGYDGLRVDTSSMPYDPMDDIGYQRIDKGDRVSVWGFMDYDLFESRELKAETIVTVREGSAAMES